MADLKIDPTKGEVDPDTGQTYYRLGDGSNVAEATRVKLSDDERSELDRRGEVEVVRGNRTITVDRSESGKAQAAVVYYD